MTEPSRFRDLHTRTYEIELLISGALVFGLLQVPGYLESGFDYWQSRLDGLATPAVTYLFLYSQMLAYSLLGTFVLHLCMRGHWVALLGLESVWPSGWDWSKLKFGPYSQPHVARQVDSLSVSIERADDRASVVFAAGALLAMVFLYSMALILVALPLGAGIAAVSGGRLTAAAGFFVMLGVIIGCVTIVPLVDRFAGHRIAADSFGGRVLARLVSMVMSLSPTRLTGPVQLVFQTHVGERAVGVAMAAAAIVLSVVMVGGLLWRSGTVRIDGWRYFDDAPSSVQFDPRHYRDSGAAQDGLRPTIDSDIIGGAYVRVYLPYRPRRHNPLLADKCEAFAAAAEAERNSVGAACVGALYTVSLNEQVLDALTYDFTRESASDFVGVLSFVDVRDLRPGRHEFTIVGPGRDAPEKATIRIPFYKE